MALTCAQRNKAMQEQLTELKKRLLSATMRHGEKVERYLKNFASKRPARSKRQKVVMDYTNQLDNNGGDNSD